MVLTWCIFINKTVFNQLIPHLDVKNLELG